MRNVFLIFSFFGIWLFPKYPCLFCYKTLVAGLLKHFYKYQWNGLYTSLSYNYKVTIQLFFCSLFRATNWGTGELLTEPGKNPDSSRFVLAARLTFLTTAVSSTAPVLVCASCSHSKPDVNVMMYPSHIPLDLTPREIHQRTVGQHHIHKEGEKNKKKKTISENPSIPCNLLSHIAPPGEQVLSQIWQPIWLSF